MYTGVYFEMEGSREEYPYISVIIPMRNEEAFIKACLESVLSCDYPHERMEVLLLDGMSRDRTREIIKEILQPGHHAEVKLLENPGLTFPAAVNAGFRASAGDYILILGAHAVYPPDYFSACIETALRTGAENTGGVLITEGLNQSLAGKAISLVLSSAFGVGNSTFRTGSNVEQEVDTVFGGCYKRSVFEKLGGFNEKLVSTSDMDFNTRLMKTGGRIIMNPAIRLTYFTRTDFGKFFRNNFRNGYWVIYPLKYLNYLPVRFRHLIPLIFVSGLLGGAALSLVWTPLAWAYLGVMSLYFMMAALFSLRAALKNPLYLLLMPFLFFILHSVYGLGSWVALIKVIFTKSERAGHEAGV